VNTFSYTYDWAGQRKTESGSHGRKAFGYDEKRQLIEAVKTDAQGQPVAGTNYDYSYHYDQLGNRLQADESGAATTYTPNNLNQYSSASFAGLARDMSYDPNGNMTTKTDSFASPTPTARRANSFTTAWANG
jgi:uncharacterized protein RhaS with RHS repeats